MLTCHACQRHVRDSEIRCPFCTATLRTGPAPGSLSSLVLVAGLTLLACSDDGSEGTSTDSNANTDDVTSESESTAETTMDTSGETTMDTGETSGETTTTDTQEGGSDYAGPPDLECIDIFEDTLFVGDNPVDTAQGHDWIFSACGDLDGGGGNDLLYRFTAPNTASYGFALVDAAFEGWLVEGAGANCNAVADPTCTVPQEALVMDLSAGQDVYLWLDGTSSGVGTIVVTEN